MVKMGLRDDVQRISRTIEYENINTENKSQRKYKIENDLLIRLEYYIKKYKKDNRNIYNINTQDEIIQKVLYSRFGELLEVKTFESPAEFVENYQTEAERIDEEYYYIFLQRHYLQAVRNVEKYMQNTKEAQQKAAEQQQIKTDILYIKKQQEAERLRKMQQQQQVQQQKQIQNNNNVDKSDKALKTLGIILTILFAPVGLIVLAILSAASKQK